MLKKMTAIGLALGLVLPGYAALAQTKQVRTETQERTEKQDMLQTGSQAAGQQVQEREQVRTETQTREQAGDSQKLQKQNPKGPGTAAAGDQLRDRDRTQDKDKDQLRDRDRIHNPAAGGSGSKGSGR